MAQLNSFLPEPIDENEEAKRLYFLERRHNLLKRSGLIEKLHTVFSGKSKESKFPIKIYTTKRRVGKNGLTCTNEEVKKDLIEERQITLRRSLRLMKKDPPTIENIEKNTKTSQKNVRNVQQVKKITNKSTGKCK